MGDNTIERPRIALAPDAIEVAKARAIAAAQDETRDSIRGSLRALLSLPLLQRERGRIRSTRGEKNQAKNEIGLLLDAQSLLDALLRMRGGRDAATGFDVFAALLLDNCSAGMTRVQAMRLVVDLIEPIRGQLDMPAGGVTFVFGEDTKERLRGEAV